MASRNHPTLSQNVQCNERPTSLSWRNTLVSYEIGAHLYPSVSKIIAVSQHTAMYKFVCYLFKESSNNFTLIWIGTICLLLDDPVFQNNRQTTMAIMELKTLLVMRLDHISNHARAGKDIQYLAKQHTLVSSDIYQRCLKFANSSFSALSKLVYAAAYNLTCRVETNKQAIERAWKRVPTWTDSSATLMRPLWLLITTISCCGC